MFGICSRKGDYIMFRLYECNNEQYKKIIDFLYERCDLVAFSLPNYFAKYIKSYNDSNSYTVLDIDNENFAEYKRVVNSVLKDINGAVKKFYTHTNYFDQGDGYLREIYILSFEQNILEFLKKFDNFSTWLYPNLPEDLCFFSNGKLLFSSLSHEDECSFFDDSIEVWKLIETIEVDYRHFDDQPSYFIQHRVYSTGDGSKPLKKDQSGDGSVSRSRKS